MIFDFKLRPIREIQPWGRAPNLTLPWFGLSDGFYRLDVDGDYLLNYAPATVAAHAREYPAVYPGPYAEYQVVRLWEDVYGMLYDVLQPLPKELQDFLEKDYAEQQLWRDKAYAWLKNLPIDHPDRERSDTLYEAATFWHNDRRLDTAYLNPGARIWMWSTKKFVTIAWDNRAIARDGIPVWSAGRGVYRLPRDDFFDEVRSFDRRFIAAVKERVDEVCATWDRHEIVINMEVLRREQAERANWFRTAMHRSAPVFSWDEVSQAMASIGRMIAGQ